MAKVVIYLMRIIAFPFFSSLALISALRGWISFSVGFLRYGGEVVALVNKKEPTVADILNFLKEKIKSEQEPDAGK